MVLNIKGNAETKKKFREMQVDFNPFNAQQREHEEMMIRHLEDDGGGGDDDEDDEDVNTKKHMLPPKIAKKKKIQSTSTVKQSTTSYGKQKKSATLGTYFMQRTTPGAQKSLQNCWQRKEAVERCDLALAKWMIDACVPFNAVNSVYYQHAIYVVTTIGPGYKRPNLHVIRGYYLAKGVDEVKIYVETYREIWKKTGCTLMVDGWTDQKRRTLINFLVYCPNDANLVITWSRNPQSRLRSDPGKPK
jgi:hypothetical protein